MLLQGIFPPITTAFYPEGNLHLKKLEQNVERYSRAPITGMVVLGSTGEAVLLSDAERREVLACARSAAAPHQVLIAGTGMESAIATLQLTECAAGLGYDLALVRTPHYYREQMNRPENMLAFYRFVADRSPLPILIYNFPQATGYDIPVDVVVQLADHPNVLGIKESSGSVEKVRSLVARTRHIQRQVQVTGDFRALTPRMRETASEGGREALSSSSAAVALVNGVRVRRKEVGFQVLVGTAQKLYDSLQAGAVGGIVAFADAAPTAMFETYTAWKDGDLELARKKQERVSAAAARVAGELGVPGVKYACDLNGYYGGPVRLPLLPLTADVKNEIEKLMAAIRN